MKRTALGRTFEIDRAVEAYALAGCALLLGFMVCQSMLGHIFQIGMVSRILLAIPLTPFFLQLLAISFLPFGKWVGHLVLVALSIYLLAVFPTCPLTLAWLALFGLNFTCWIFKR
jgi:hypothetical protein